MRRAAKSESAADEARGDVKAPLDGKGIKNVISSADLAVWMIAQLTASGWVQQRPLIGYGSRRVHSHMRRSI